MTACEDTEKKEENDSSEEVHKAAKKKARENLKFRSFLKNHAEDEKLNRQLLTLHNALFERYDCSQCANWCRAYSTVLEKDEIADCKTMPPMAIRICVGVFVRRLLEGDFINNGGGLRMDVAAVPVGLRHFFIPAVKGPDAQLDLRKV